MSRAGDKHITVYRNDIEYKGECEDLANLFRLMDLEDAEDGPVPAPNPGPTPDPMCKAVKANGDRCGNTQRTARMIGNFCQHHQSWEQRGGKVLP